MICDKCNQKNIEEDLFCIKCGNILVPIHLFQRSLSSKQLEINYLNTRYGTLKEMKKGGMGKIFMGVDKNLSKVCAIKELLEDLAASKTDRRRSVKMFEQEATLLASLNHESLPRVYDYFILEDRYYLIMDYIEGDDLLTVIKKKYTDGCPEEQVLEWGIQLCEVLEYLHGKNPPIIYRDLKPDNIMLKKADDKVFLIDFGIARLIGEERVDTSFATAGYASPEQCGGKECDVRSDTYSLGATMYHLLTGRRPKDLTGETLKKINSRISLYMDKVVTKARSIYVKDRYQTAWEFKNDLLLWKDPFSMVQSSNGLSETDLLIVQLQAKDGKAILNAIKSLSKIRERKATAALVKMLDNENITIQKNVVLLLGEIGDPVALDGLLNLLRSGSKNLYKTVIDSLEKINWTDDGEINFYCLQDLFDHRDKQVRLFAFSRQSRFKYRGFYYHLIEGLSDEESHVRKLCAQGLAEMGNPHALPSLKKALEKESLFSLTTKRALQKAIQILEEIEKEKKEVEISSSGVMAEQVADNKYKTDVLLPPETKPEITFQAEVKPEITFQESEPEKNRVEEYRAKIKMKDTKDAKPSKSKEQRFIIKKARGKVKDVSEDVTEKSLLFKKKSPSDYPAKESPVETEDRGKPDEKEKIVIQENEDYKTGETKVDSGELKKSDWKKEELEDYRTRETKVDSGELKISDWKKEEGKDYRTRVDSGDLKKSDKAADRQRLEAYRSIIGLEVSAKSEKDAIKDLKLQLERERKELEEEKKREIEKRKKYIEDRDRKSVV